MKTAEPETTDELRPEYKRSDFGQIVRGKYANQIKEKTNVVLLEQVTKASIRLTGRASGLR